MLTWRQIGLHEKPIFLLNTESYWTPLIALLDHVITEGFAGDTLRDFLTTVETVDQLEEVLASALS